MLSEEPILMLRLVENFPAWEIHALLRFCGVSYKVDYSPMPVALGRTLPIIIDNEGVYQGKEIIECIQRHSRCKTQYHEDEIDELVSSVIRQRFDHLWTALMHSSGHEKEQAIRASPFGLNFYVGHRYDLQNWFSMQR